MIIEVLLAFCLTCYMKGNYGFPSFKGTSTYSFKISSYGLQTSSNHKLAYGKFILTSGRLARKQFWVRMQEEQSQSNSNSTASAAVNNIYGGYGSPQIVPFDFARADIIPERLRDDAEVNDYTGTKNRSLKESKSAPTVKSNTVLDITRPTGYANDDDDDEGVNAEWLPMNTDDANPLLKFLKDVYVGSPYDSNGRKQARFVARSITLISFAIGIVFTVVWYAFPGKFISIRSPQTEANTLGRSIPAYVDPDELLRNDIASSPDWEYFDDNLRKVPTAPAIISNFNEAVRVNPSSEQTGENSEQSKGVVPVDI